MSIIGRDANKNKKCFAACQPGAYCECLGKTIEEKDCGFSDISCILQHMSSVAKSEELVGNLQIAGDIECWVDQIRQLNATPHPPVAGLAELTDEQIMAFWQAMNNASKFFCSNNYAPLVNWAASHERAVLTAARAYLAALPEKGDGYEIDLRRFRPAVKLAHTKARQQLLALENGGYPEHYRPVLEADEAEQFALLEYIDALPQPKCRNCNGHGEIGYTTGQTPESFEQGEYPCPDCNPEQGAVPAGLSDDRRADAKKLIQDAVAATAQIRADNSVPLVIDNTIYGGGKSIRCEPCNPNGGDFVVPGYRCKEHQGNTPPPVAGLADVQIMELWQAMNNASKFFCSNNSVPVGEWAASHEQAVLKAAREFLGKVG